MEHKLFDELRHELNALAEEAMDLASKLTENAAERLNRRQREVAVVACQLRISSQISDAKFFAMEGNLEGFDASIKMVRRWIEYSQHF